MGPLQAPIKSGLKYDNTVLVEEVLVVFIPLVPCNGSTNVEDTLIYFVSKFIVDYAFLL